jgi:Holliday junction resolvasome RuvABC DNA-binding subunit
MSEDKNKEESVIELAKRVGSKEAARIITEQKSKLKQEKGFEKTGQYYFDLRSWFKTRWSCKMV